MYSFSIHSVKCKRNTCANILNLLILIGTNIAYYAVMLLSMDMVEEKLGKEALPRQEVIMENNSYRKYFSIPDKKMRMIIVQNISGMMESSFPTNNNK